MEEQPQLYPIRAVAKLTGISLDTLRAWERRYDAVRPRRCEQGRGRLYTDGDIQRLRLLRDAVDAGHAIGQVAGLCNEDLGHLVEQQSRNAPRKPSSVPICLEALRSAVDRYDALTVDRELGRLAALLQPRELVCDVVQPMMRWVGERWEQGQLTIAQEHVASSALRNLLGSLIRLHAPGTADPKIVLATPTGERHEFGILSAAMLAVGGGLGVLYLGLELPSSEIVDAARKTSASVVILGVTAADDDAGAVALAESICAALAPDVEVWVGGCKSPSVETRLRRLPVHYLESFAKLEQELVRVGARY